jgi:hypothetical protein
LSSINHDYDFGGGGGGGGGGDDDDDDDRNNNTKQLMHYLFSYICLFPLFFTHWTLIV